MHARHRSPGNGYRMGMGPRISPEISGKGHGFYNAEYRNPTRGYGRGQSHMKSFRASPPRPSKSGDIFMEAGKLAAEYLVSKGFLPASALSGKWQNGSFKKQIVNYHDFRSQEGDSMHFSSEGRPSALSRLGHSVSDAGQNRRRYTDGYSSSGSQNLPKERRKGGSFRNHSSDWNREYARTVSSSERTRVSHDKEVDSDTVANIEEQQVVKDASNDSQKSDSDELAPKGEMVHLLQSDAQKHNMQDETGSKANSPGKDIEHESVGEPSKGAVESFSLVSETGDLKDCSHDNESSKPSINEDSPKPNVSSDSASSSKDVTDLLSLGNFAKIPTKTRSSLVRKSSVMQSCTRNDEQNFSCTGANVKTEVAVEDDSVAGSSDDMELNKTHGSDHQKTLVIAEDVPVRSVKDADELGHLFVGEQGKFVRSQSLPDNVLLHVSEPELVQGIPDLQRSSSMVTEIGEKRPLEQSDDWNEAKRPRGWLNTTCIKDDTLVSLSEFAHEKGISEGNKPSPSTSEKLSMPVNHDFMVASSQLTRIDSELMDKYSEEKQLVPSSFKICDLNLMEASDVNDNIQSHSVPGSSNTKPNQELTQVDIGLTMRNSSNSGQDSFRTSNCSNIEIIDLENDSGPEDQGMDDMESKNGEVFVDMNGDATNASDQYDGLMINEYLKNFSTSPHVSADIDPHSLQNDGMNPMPSNINIHNDEGALGDDDSIYMSLDEIPLSFLQVWGQPPAQ